MSKKIAVNKENEKYAEIIINEVNLILEHINKIKTEFTGVLVDRNKIEVNYGEGEVARMLNEDIPQIVEQLDLLASNYTIVGNQISNIITKQISVEKEISVLLKGEKNDL